MVPLKRNVTLGSEHCSNKRKERNGLPKLVCPSLLLHKADCCARVAMLVYDLRSVMYMYELLQQEHSIAQDCCSISSDVVAVLRTLMQLHVGKMQDHAVKRAETPWRSPTASEHKQAI